MCMAATAGKEENRYINFIFNRKLVNTQVWDKFSLVGANLKELTTFSVLRHIITVNRVVKLFPCFHNGVGK